MKAKKPKNYLLYS